MAYTNNFAGAVTTTLYNIEIPAGTTAMLYIQNPPNDSTLVPVGALGIQTESANPMVLILAERAAGPIPHFVPLELPGYIPLLS